jgi:hypothetical protein
MKSLKEIFNTIVEVFKEDPIGALADLLFVIFMFFMVYIALWIAAA